ncbi:MAG: type I-B CRISPR-associated protein Cas7/Cst2/DevR [Caldicoprobacterales bacterium]
MRKGLTITFIIEGESANYGEGFGNITSLKKISRGDGETYTYISRQALRYNIVQQMGCDDTQVEAMGSGSKKVIQFHPDATIDKYPEIDLFGYMKTVKGEGAVTRSAVVRLSNAIALESYQGDIDFLTNMGLAARIGENNSIAQSEIHKTFYTYTIAVDLDRIGIDRDIEIPKQEKIERIHMLLDTLKFLYRDIKGRRENLSPVFATGGVYKRKNPFFENRIALNRMYLDIEQIKAVLNLDEDISVNTRIGYIPNTFTNDKKIREELSPMDMKSFFEEIKKDVEAAYNEGN